MPKVRNTLTENSVRYLTVDPRHGVLFKQTVGSYVKAIVILLSKTLFGKIDILLFFREEAWG